MLSPQMDHFIYLVNMCSRFYWCLELSPWLSSDVIIWQSLLMPKGTVSLPQGVLTEELWPTALDSHKNPAVSTKSNPQTVRDRN